MAIYVTITGQKHYFGLLPFAVGTVLTLHREPDNVYDPDAVAVFSSTYGKVGYIAQTAETRADGTVSAGALSSLVKAPAQAAVRFIAGDFIIAEVL